ncbi:GNAT family N-acetyltransferase [Terracidiphilus gabretensis]|uniref:GNAT family N-acetyltransferase n=1 Tax=Terracidiphilus gabretensis TaxID=1577687 RepID=UPI001E3B3546|nr:GNAT family N-acetyltransferase [Terracidiphilus gabretensis]
MTDELAIRPLSISDAEAVAILNHQLGYPSSVADLLPRIEQLLHSSERATFAGILESRLIGWIDVAIERHLQSSDTAVIGGLVVHEDVRGRGIGRRLCQAAEDWARGRGISIVRVRSQIKREDAHRFYLQDGYEQVKISAVFEKKLV